MKLSSILFFLVPTLFIACGKDEPPITVGEISSCHDKTVWDSLTTSNELIGEWDWKYVEYFWSPSSDGSCEYDGLSINFKTDGTLEVWKNGQISQTAIWNVVNESGNLFMLKFEPWIEQLPGRIYFCDDLLVFYLTYADGSDNYFKRKE